MLQAYQTPAHQTEPADYTEHAFVWRDGVMTDLGTLGGLNSSVPFPQKNTRVLIVGQAKVPNPIRYRSIGA